MASFEDEKQFISHHAPEIKPLLGKGENLVPNNEAEAAKVLEEYENRLYSLENPNANPDAKRVLVTANDPGAYNTLKPLLEKLTLDPRCRGVAALVSGLARKNLETEFKNMSEVQDSSPLLMPDILEFSAQKEIDVVVATLSSLNGPESLALFGGKSSLKAKKLFLVADGWGGLGSQFTRGNYPVMDNIEAITCPDEVAKKMFHHQFPGISEKKFEVLGSPVVDGLVVENPEKFINQAREKFGLDADTIALIYYGDISAGSKEEYGTDEAINEKTFTKTLEGLIKFARENPEHEYALLLRPHPRDPNKEELFSLAGRANLPANLRFIPAGNDIASIQETRYAGDVALSICSTENFFAPRLGRVSVFLAYGENLGGKIVDQIYGQEIVAEMEKAEPLMRFAGSADQLKNILKNCGRAPKIEESAVKNNAIKKICDRILD